MIAIPPAHPRAPSRAGPLSFCAILLAAACLGVPTAHSEAPSGADDCRGLSRATERLACYDALFPPVQSEPGVEDEFGLTASQRLARRGEAPVDEGLQGIEATLLSVEHLANGDAIVELDTGARWRITERSPPGALKAGRTVRIRPAALGTFLMTPGGGRALRARRLP